MTMAQWAGGVVLMAGAALAARQPQPERWSWNRAEATVTETGDLSWKPEPFHFEAGPSVRYIDFEAGDDSHAGTSREAAWKHHPWDPAASGQSRSCTGVQTYVFRRGVTYRGTLRAGQVSGTGENPVRLTSDPGWGAGEAVIAGSERVGGWQRGGHATMPDAGKVWRAELPFAPRCVWQVAADGAVTRLALARTPNWRESDPEDVHREWWTWQQPQWWTDKHKTIGRDGKPIHLGIDKEHLTGTAADYVGGLVWSEWGIVMGTPYPATIERFDAAQGGIGFQGFWMGDSGKIIKGNRYFLEDRPNFLDAPGEFWFEKRGAGGTLYVRLAGDADPDSVGVEAARQINLIDAEALRHVRISGLSFRFSNVFWDLTARPFVHRDVQGACVRLLGTGEDVRIDHCRFEHVSQAIRLKAVADSDAMDGIMIADNEIVETDHGAITLEGSERWAKADPPFAHFGDARVLRNRLLLIGRRAIRSDSSHALCVSFPETLEVAGNILDRCYGAGIFLFMGKGSTERRDAPLARNLVHHNKVTAALLAANDWGGIETWQGGPHYVFDNISGNPNGYWNWAYSPSKPASARLGYAYYLDGSFKNYHFNNVAWGLDNDPAGAHCNASAFYEAVPTTLNTFFNNTCYRFAHGSGWSPAGGRHLFLGNLWLDFSVDVFEHGRQKEDQNAVYRDFPYETMGYGRNLFWKPPPQFGRIEGAGEAAGLAGFQALAAAHKMLAADVGSVIDASPVRNAAAHDFRPVAGSRAVGRGARVFVPWSLARTVGEWQFRRNGADPRVALDDHWYLSAGVVDRDTYHRLPRNDLQGTGIDAASYVDGPLENWTAGSIRLNGHDQWLVLPAPPSAVPARTPAVVGAAATLTPADWVEVSAPASLAAGEEASVTVRLRGAAAGEKPGVHLHWLKKDGWGGFDAVGRHAGALAAGVQRFAIKPEARQGLDAFSLLVFSSPTGDFREKTRSVTVKIPLRAEAVAASSPLPGPLDMQGSYLVEAYFRTVPGAVSGAIVSRLSDEGGCELVVDKGGAARFLLQAGGTTSVATRERVNDGAWHHVVAEFDRPAATARIYLDGVEQWTSRASGVGVPGGGAAFRVGKGADGACLAGEIEFLRIALSTLAESRTSIEELYDWEFDGPFLRDFAGRRPAGSCRAVGAFEPGP